MPRRPWLVGGTLFAAGLIALVWAKEREHFAQGDRLAPAVVQETVPAGARPRTFPLADGSRVTLAPGSSLESRGAFGDTERTLRLTGEALFSVAAGSAPFVVLAAGVRVEDVSTAFVVRAIPGADGALPRALVAVTEGAVRVDAARFRQTVREGSALMVDSAGVHVTLGAAEARGSVAWTSGALLFADEPVTAVVERLARWTGLVIEVAPSLRSRRLSLAVENESAETTVQRLAAALGAQAAQRDGRWSVFPQ